MKPLTIFGIKNYQVISDCLTLSGKEAVDYNLRRRGLFQGESFISFKNHFKQDCLKFKTNIGI